MNKPTGQEAPGTPGPAQEWDELNELAKKIMDCVPVSMQGIRAEIRASAREKLSLPQFRILAAIQRGQNRVSEIARLHDVSQAAMSKMVDALVSKGWVARAEHSADRRQIELKLTADGRQVFQKTRREARKGLEPRLVHLSGKEKAELSRGLELLQRIFS